MKQECNPGGGNVQMEILWTNPSPYTEFAAQKVTLPSKAANYDFFIITTSTGANNYGYGTSGIVAKGQKNLLTGCLPTNESGAAYANWIKRTVSVASDGKSVEFGKCVYGYQSGDTTFNGAEVPLNIIGLKF